VMKLRDKRLQEYSETEGKRWELLRDKYRGERCFVIGNGPSLNRQDLRPLAGEFTIACNEFLRHKHFAVIDPDLLCICSENLFGARKNAWVLPKQMRFDSELYELWESRPNTITWVFPWYYKPAFDEQRIFPADKVRYVFFEKHWEFVQDTKTMNFDIATQPLLNARSVLLNMCVPIAYYLGFSDLYLVGCDCDYYRETWEKEPEHFYEREEHRKVVVRTPAEFERFKKRWGPDGYVMHNYGVVKEHFERGGRTIYNATEGGRLEMFPKVTLNSIVGGDAVR